MELRKAHGELERFKTETAALEAEVDRFAGRIGKYQENEDKLNEDLTRYILDVNQFKHRYRYNIWNWLMGTMGSLISKYLMYAHWQKSFSGDCVIVYISMNRCQN